MTTPAPDEKDDDFARTFGRERQDDDGLSLGSIIALLFVVAIAVVIWVVWL